MARGSPLGIADVKARGGSKQGSYQHRKKRKKASRKKSVRKKVVRKKAKRDFRKQPPTAAEVARAQDEAIKLASEDPVWWVRNWMGADPWPKQEEILRSVCDNEVTVVPSCHAAGKDWGTAHVVIWFTALHRNSLVVTTAPTARQVRHILWKEIGDAHANSRFPIGGRMLTTHWEIRRKWEALGFTSSEWNPDKFSGFHAPYVLVVVDEASGVSDVVYEAIESLLSSGYKRRLLLIGNPTNPLGEFRRRSRDPEANVITIPAFDTPNFTETGVTDQDIQNGRWRAKVKRYVDKHGSLPRPYLVDPAYAAGVFKRRGANSPSYLARVRAKFPTESPDTLVPLADVEFARNYEARPGEPNELACDVARLGPDRTVIGHRQGYRLRIPYIGAKTRNTETAGKIIEYQQKTGATVIKVDDDGVGGGVTDILIEHYEDDDDVNVVPLRGGSTKDVNEPDRFYNCRGEWGWTLRELLEEKKLDLPDDDDLEAEIMSVKYKNDSRGRVRIAEKDDIREELGKSPDLFDTMMYLVAAPTSMKQQPKLKAVDFGPTRPSHWRT